MVKHWSPLSAFNGEWIWWNKTTISWRISRKISRPKQRRKLKCLLVSISPKFYEQLFRTKVFWAAFLFLGLGLYFFGKRKLAQKAARKMLVKLPQECINCFCKCEFKWAEKRKSQIMHQIAKSRTTNSSHLLFCHQNSWLIRGSTFSLSLHLSFSRFNNIQSSHSMIGSGSFTLCLSFCLSMFLLLLILSLGLSASVIRIFLTFSHPPSTFCPSFLPLAVSFSLLSLYFYLSHFWSLIESVFFSVSLSHPILVYVSV